MRTGRLLAYQGLRHWNGLVSLALCCLIQAFWSPAFGQTSSSVLPARPDSLASAAHHAGVIAANDAQVGSYFAGGFLGGVGMGIGGALLAGDRARFLPGFAAVAGAAVVVTTFSSAAERDGRSDQLPVPVGRNSALYDSLFAEAFANRLRLRGQKATLWGAFTGTALGVLSGVWLISRWLDT